MISNSQEANSPDNEPNILTQNSEPASQLIPPPNPPKKNSPWKIILIILSVLGIAIAGYLLIFTILAYTSINQSFKTCKDGREQLYADTDNIVREFNSIDLIPGQESATSKVEKQDGDCVDSLPTITVERLFTTSAEAGSAFDSMKNALIGKGYKQEIDDSYTGLNPCSFEDNRYTFTKGDKEIQIVLNCSKYIVKSEEWRKIPITSANAYLRVTWSYPE